MDFYQIIANSFQSTIESISLSVDDLAEPLERASEAMTNALVNDHKIIACGNGADAAIAQLLICHLQHNLEHERPGLPAMALSQDAASITAIANYEGLDEIYSRQLNALGQAGDVLVCINSATAAANLERVIQSGHKRNMPVILLSTTRDSTLIDLLEPEDIALMVNAARHTRALELHTMVIHSLCELIDHHLFGSFAGTSP
ncbi:MAG: D-sedoheptulose 7-phosphate isomerase [Halieaceae bacterium]|jgi:D-sedoheptulose 7-phosphate isomerase